MKTRKSHVKSRNGCCNCKERHVKCDEQGPPCANCVSRNTASSCEYHTSNSRSSSSLQSHPLRQSPSGSDRSLTRLSPQTSILGAPSGLDTLLQLELMHRWTSSTYQAFVAVPPDVQFMQINVPRGALEHNFLLNGVMSISALEIAASGHPRAAYYSKRAMEFYDASSGSFRAQLEQGNNPTPEWIFLHSYIVSLINLGLASASGPEARFSIEATMTMFELYIGTAIIGYRNAAKLMTGSYASSVSYALKAIVTPLPSSLDAATEECFEQLRTLANYLTVNPQYIRATSAPKLFATWQAMYQEAIPQLYRCFLEDEKQMMGGNCLMFPVLTGPDYLDAVRRRDPMALVILMIWATLIDRMANVAWWAKNLGVNLVAETVENLLQETEGIVLLPEFYDCVAYAHGQLGTRALSDIPWADRASKLGKDVHGFVEADSEQSDEEKEAAQAAYSIAVHTLRGLSID